MFISISIFISISSLFPVAHLGQKENIGNIDNNNKGYDYYNNIKEENKMEINVHFVLPKSKDKIGRTNF